MSRPIGFRILFLALLAGLFSACVGPATRPPQPPAVTQEASGHAPSVEQLLAGMTLEQKVGQIMVIGFEGPNYDTGLRTMIEKYHVGGVIFFARNVESPAQVARTTNDLQASALAASGVGLFLAIDQEGGRVARLTTDKGFTEFPGAMALGASALDLNQAAANARRVGSAMALEMRAVGLNTDFAPDLDVNNNPANPVIGIRSFGSDATRVAELGVAFLDGLQANGVLAFGKHFPGHGDTGTDSHVDLPIVNQTRGRLDTVEFVPFRAAIAAHVAGIMSAHVSFPTIDATPGLPGTLSPKVLTDLLRDELHFDGLVATDSLEMGALGKSGFPAPRAAARALRAGADLLLFNSGYALHQEAVRQIVAEVNDGTIPLARLDQAVRRALTAKARFGLLRPASVDVAVAAKITSAPEHRALAVELAGASITLLRDDSGRLPLAAKSTPIVVAVPGAAGLAAALHGLEVPVHEQPSPTETTAVLRTIAAHPGTPVIVTLSGAGARPGQVALAKKIIETGAPVIACALREPYDLLALAENTPGGRETHAARATTLLATYGNNPVALQALAAVLRGELKPAGHLPVDLPGLYPLGAGWETFAMPQPLLRTHAHNDYEHARPLLDALEHGFCSIEADVHLVDGKLLVAHDRNSVKPERTLEALYLDPLRERIRQNGGRVYRDGPPVVLLVDVKSAAAPTYAVLDELLKNYADILTVFRGEGVESNAITVIVSGSRAKKEMAAQAVRYAALDGRGDDLAANTSPTLAPLVSEDWNNAFPWRWQGPMPDAVRAALVQRVALAHAQGRKIRFWNTPDRPDAWKILFDAGVDLINTDDLSGLQNFLLAQSPSGAGGT